MASIVATIYNIIQDEENKGFNILTPFSKQSIFYCEALKIQEKKTKTKKHKIIDLTADQD